MMCPRSVSTYTFFGWLVVNILVAEFTLAPAQVVSQDTAYSHLLQIVAPSGDHEPEALAARQASFGRHLRLDEEQTAILIDVASKYRTFITELQNRAKLIAGPAGSSRPSQNEKEQLRALNASRKQYLSTLISELNGRLDDQGDQLIQDHLNNKMIPNIQIRSTGQ